MRKARTVALSATLLVASAVVAAALFLDETSHTKGSRLPHAVKFLGAKIEAFRQDTGYYPSSLHELAASGSVRPELGPYARERELADPWGNPYYYRVAPSGTEFALFSLGADGKLGVGGEDQDVQYASSKDES